uniref:Protein kinase domain-containing protein n=1 Tax=Oreochromis aureus TaxID=47969 RepID=A0AAZ1XS19_OREAU
MHSVQTGLWNPRPPFKHVFPIPAPPPSNSRPAHVTSTTPAKRITFYKSGDSQFGGVRMAIHKRSFKCFDALLDDLSQKVPLPFGVRTVTTPRGTHTIKHLEQLQDGGCYLCSDRRQAKPVNMELVNKHSGIWYHHNRRPQRPETSSATPPGHLHMPYRQRRILLVKNSEPGMRRSVVLSRRTARSLRAFLDEVSEVMQFHVRKIYTVEGRRVKSYIYLNLHSIALQRFNCAKVTGVEATIEVTGKGTETEVEERPTSAMSSKSNLSAKSIKSHKSTKASEAGGEGEERAPSQMSGTSVKSDKSAKSTKSFRSKCDGNEMVTSGKVKDRKIQLQFPKLTNPSSSEDDLEISEGTILGDHHMVESFLGEGGFGVVTRCRNTKNNQIVAIKVNKSDPEILQQAKQEIFILEQLQRLDPDRCNIVEWNGYFLDGERICLNFELLDQSLWDYIGGWNNQGLPIRELRPILHQIANALFHLGSVGIVHADLKPANIMVVNRHESPVKVKLIDFGLACPASAVSPGYRVGTVGYCAPEVMLGIPYDEAIDMWALGLVETRYIKLKRLDDLEQLLKVRRGPENGQPLFVRLIKQMLALDANQRITPSEVLKHPFFNTGLSRSAPCTDMNSTGGENLVVSQQPSS